MKANFQNSRDIVGKRGEDIQVLTKQGDQIHLRFLLQPLLKSHAQRGHIESHQEAALVEIRSGSH